MDIGQFLPKAESTATPLGGFPIREASTPVKTEKATTRTTTTTRNTELNKKVEALEKEFTTLQDNLGNVIKVLFKSVKDLQDKTAQQDADIVQLSQKINTEFLNLQNQLGTTTTVATATSNSLQAEMRTIMSSIGDIRSKQSEAMESVNQLVEVFSKLVLASNISGGDLEKLLSGEDLDNDKPLKLFGKSSKIHL